MATSIHNVWWGGQGHRKDALGKVLGCRSSVLRLESYSSQRSIDMQKGDVLREDILAIDVHTSVQDKQYFVSSLRFCGGGVTPVDVSTCPLRT